MYNGSPDQNGNIPSRLMYCNIDAYTRIKIPYVESEKAINEFIEQLKPTGIYEAKDFSKIEQASGEGITVSLIYRVDGDITQAEVQRGADIVDKAIAIKQQRANKQTSVAIDMLLAKTAEEGEVNPRGKFEVIRTANPKTGRVAKVIN
jgi:hypothetical protein